MHSKSSVKHTEHFYVSWDFQMHDIPKKNNYFLKNIIFFNRQGISHHVLLSILTNWTLKDKYKKI